MTTEPGLNRDAELAALKREPLPRPHAWRIRQTEVERLAARGDRCETRRCHGVIVAVTRRWWRSTEAARVLLAEHLVCEQHGTEFAERHHIGVDPPGEVTVRHLDAAELAEADGCDWQACRTVAAWVFTESYTTRGEPDSDAYLSCDRHAAAFADRFHIDAPEAGEGGAR
jgi:hypothetical protein